MDSILKWNEVALEANRVSHTDGSKEQNGPTLSSRALAIVHLAMYDAYAGVTNDPANLPHYIQPTQPAPAGSAAPAAVAGAAFTTLVSLFPSQLEFFERQLTPDETQNPGFDFGITVGQSILKDREDDPSASQGKHRSKKGRGRHRIDPDNPGQGFHGPLYGEKSKGFAISKRHTLDAPPFKDGKDPKYREALRQVRSKGIKPELMGTLPDKSVKTRRLAEETLIGIYWGYDGAAGLGTPPRLYNQIVRKIAAAKNNTEADNARLFAFVNAAMGDAGILAWDEKYSHDFWRPVVGIREHDESFWNTGSRTADVGRRNDLRRCRSSMAATRRAVFKFSQPGSDDRSSHLPVCQRTIRQSQEFHSQLPCLPLRTCDIWGCGTAYGSTILQGR